MRKGGANQDPWGRVGPDTRPGNSRHFGTTNAEKHRAKGWCQPGSVVPSSSALQRGPSAINRKAQYD